MQRDIFAVSISDAETRSTIVNVYLKYGALLEPHGAVGWAGLMRYLSECGDWSPCVSLETADPAKFPEEILRLTGVNPPLPAAMARLDEVPERFQKMNGDYISLKKYLSSLLG
jgi:threonine synthase